MSIISIILHGLGLYMLTGFIVAVSFMTFGVARIVPGSMTAGARMIVLPGLIVLWPYVLARWLTFRGGP